MSFARVPRHPSVLALNSFLVLSACTGGTGDKGDNTQPDARTGANIDGGPEAPDAQPALPACANAQASYTSAESVEVIELSGRPNVALRFGGDDGMGLFPSGAEYGVGDFDLSADTEWTVLFCIDINVNDGTCGARPVVQSGTLKITTLNEASPNRRIAGELIDVVFVDDADSPTCQVAVSASFDEPIPE